MKLKIRYCHFMFNSLVIKWPTTGISLTFYVCIFSYTVYIHFGYSRRNLKKKIHAYLPFRCRKFALNEVFLHVRCRLPLGRCQTLERPGILLYIVRGLLFDSLWREVITWCYYISLVTSWGTYQGEIPAQVVWLPHVWLLSGQGWFLWWTNPCSLGYNYPLCGYYVP